MGEVFPDALVNFLPEGEFDHTPAIVTLDMIQQGGKRPFKYFNMWSKAKEVKGKIEENWRMHCDGVPMFKVVQKLKRLRGVFKGINKEKFADIEKSVEVKREILLQCLRDCSPGDSY